MAEHLLPPNATPFEKALAASFARIQTISVPVAQVRHPQTCPAPLLPWLAYHHGVDYWKQSWSEPVKRAVIAASYDVKKSKGTRYGVLKALEAQGFQNVRYETWFEYGGSPYRFRIALDIDPQLPWREEDDELLIGTVLRAKSVRSRLESIAFTRPSPPCESGIATALWLEEVITLGPDTSDDIIFPPPSEHLAAGLMIIETITTGAVQ